MSKFWLVVVALFICFMIAVNAVANAIGSVVPDLAAAAGSIIGLGALSAGLMWLVMKARQRGSGTSMRVLAALAAAGVVGGFVDLLLVPESSTVLNVMVQQLQWFYLIAAVWSVVVIVRPRTKGKPVEESGVPGNYPRP